MAPLAPWAIVAQWKAATVEKSVVVHNRAWLPSDRRRPSSSVVVRRRRPSSSVVASRRVVSRRVVSRRAVSCRVVSCRVSCRVVSCRGRPAVIFNIRNFSAVFAFQFYVQPLRFDRIVSCFFEHASSVGSCCPSGRAGPSTMAAACFQGGKGPRGGRKGPKGAQGPKAGTPWGRGCGGRAFPKILIFRNAPKAKESVAQAILA